MVLVPVRNTIGKSLSTNTTMWQPGSFWLSEYHVKCDCIWTKIPTKCICWVEIKPRWLFSTNEGSNDLEMDKTRGRTRTVLYSQYVARLFQQRTFYEKDELGLIEQIYHVFDLWPGASAE